MESGPRHWGEQQALLDEQEARRRLLEATGRCIVRRGDAQFRVAEVADEAGVARSTVYRYFATRDDLLTALLVSRTDAALETVVRSLPHPDDAALSIPTLILEAIGLVDGNPLNEALFSAESRAFVSALELSSESLVDAPLRHFVPLFEQWRADGKLYDDVDIRETVRWMNAVSLFLLAPPWRERSRAAKREFLDRYLVRALVPR
jgi:TetR/AcrR family transcriptional regulator